MCKTECDAVADTYDPERFLPLGEAYQQAFDAIENWTPGVAKNDAELHEQLNKRDAAERKVERLMRNALADGLLCPFIRATNGPIEKLVYREESDREKWRQESFGVPGIQNVPDHLTNPGPDTDGRPIFLSTSNFKRWLTPHSSNKQSYSARRGAKPKFDWPPAEAEARRLMEYHGAFSQEDPEWNAQARLEEAIEKYFEKQLGPDAVPSKSMIRLKVSEWLTRN
jgi:hypothetical protein